MNEFIAKYQDQLSGALSGFDRIVWRGNLRALCGVPGMDQYLATEHVLYKDFGRHVLQVSRQIKQASVARAEREGRVIQYVSSGSVRKEEIARTIAAEQKITQGLVCVLSSVEPCYTFDIYRDRSSHQLKLVQRERKCLHLYQYWIHPQVGFLHARIQTWFPFRIQICLNGREWRARQMEQGGLKFLRHDNGFPWGENFAQAQRLLDQQLKTPWPRLLDPLAKELNPQPPALFPRFPVSYDWSAYQTEWATDGVFRKQAFLRRLYPKLVHHGMTPFGSADVLRFLGRRVRLDGTVPAHFSGEVWSDVQERPEGIRLKHGVNGNTVKVYDKAFTPLGSVRRFETTIHRGDDFRVYRPKEGEPNGARAWRPMRRGIADLHRRAEVSQRANERYMNALASVDDSTTIEELTCRLEPPVPWRGRPVRGLHLFESEDRHLLRVVSRGEFTLNGLRNRDRRTQFFPGEAPSPREKRRRSAWVSRKLRLLRAPGLLQKVPPTHRYLVTAPGRKILTAALTLTQATIAQLTSLAA
jgi:hypothetical protein